jgi:6-phosphogluconolactonase
MMNYETHIFDDAAAVARGVADLIAEKALQSKLSGQKCSIAVSGGSTPKALFELLAEEEYRTTIAWEAILLFWVDERCVPPAHAESNYGMTYDALLQYAFIPAENVFRMKGEEIPGNEALRYGKLLHQLLPARNSMPVFDLILLGMGDDGHTASIFPDQMHLLNSDKAVEVATHPVSGQKRITLTGPAINEARQLVFMITGQGKADIVATIVEKKEVAKKYPASYVHDTTGKTEFYMDKAAAAKLKQQ